MYRIAIGADHRGYALKEALTTKQRYGSVDVSWEDVGTDSLERTDYPLYAYKVVQQLIAGKVDYGVLICGSGIGISIAANRFATIYAGLVWNEELATMAKEHDNVNVLVLPADYMSTEQAEKCVAAWLSASFFEGRYRQRLVMLEDYAKKEPS